MSLETEDLPNLEPDSILNAEEDENEEEEEVTRQHGRGQQGRRKEEGKYHQEEGSTKEGGSKKAGPEKADRRRMMGIPQTRPPANDNEEEGRSTNGLMLQSGRSFER